MSKAIFTNKLPDNLKVSVVICTYNRPQSLSTCLESLEGQTIIPYEVVIVVDGGMTSEVQKVIDAFKAKDRLLIVQVTNSERKGTTASMNISVEAASGEIIAYIDDDVVLVPEWLAEIITGYQENEDAAGVGGRVINMRPYSESFLFKLLSGAKARLFRKKMGKVSFIGVPYAIPTADFDGCIAVDYLPGGNMSYRREILTSYKLDETLEYANDLNFGVILTKKEGKKLIYNPKAIAYHYPAQGGHARGAERLYLTAKDYTVYILNNFNLKYLRLALYYVYILIFGLAIFSRPPRPYLKAILEGIKEYRERSKK